MDARHTPVESKLFEELVELQPELEMLSLKTEDLQLSLFQNLSKKVQSGDDGDDSDDVVVEEEHGEFVGHTVLVR